jgi:hypothetical protein
MVQVSAALVAVSCTTCSWFAIDLGVRPLTYYTEDNIITAAWLLLHLQMPASRQRVQCARCVLCLCWSGCSTC